MSLRNDADLSVADYSVKQSVMHSASVPAPSATTQTDASSVFRGDHGQKVVCSGEENHDDDDEEDRLVIDLDHTDPHRSGSEYSVLSDHCSNHEHNENNSNSINRRRKANEVTTHTASDKPPRPDFRLKTTFGNHVMSSSTSFSPLPIYTYTSDKHNSRVTSTYSDISDDENNNITSWTAGARMSSHVDRQPVLKFSSPTSSAATAMDVGEPLVATSQMTTVMTSTRHPRRPDPNHPVQRAKLDRPSRLPKLSPCSGCSAVRGRPPTGRTTQLPLPRWQRGDQKARRSLEDHSVDFNLNRAAKSMYNFYNHQYPLRRQRQMCIRDRIRRPAGRLKITPWIST